MPKISVVIPTLANAKSMPYLQKCVEMIRKNSEEDHDIIVMVNGENFPNMRKFPARVLFRREQGQCGAVNAAAREVQTEWMVVTDDDSMFPPQWERIFEHTDKSDVICMNSMESGKIGSAPPYVVNNCGQTVEDFNQEKFEKEAVDLGMTDLKVVGGQNPEKGFSYPFLIRKSLWDKVGGYDEAYDPWGSNSDSDLFYKFTLAGVTPLRDRRILNYHFSQISGTFEDAQHSYWMRNRSYFEKKWGFRRADSPEIWNSVTIPYEQLTYKPDWAKIPTSGQEAQKVDAGQGSTPNTPPNTPTS